VLVVGVVGWVWFEDSKMYEASAAGGEAEH
jgi:hypothetical protein